MVAVITNNGVGLFFNDLSSPRLSVSTILRANLRHERPAPASPYAHPCDRKGPRCISRSLPTQQLSTSRRFFVRVIKMKKIFPVIAVLGLCWTGLANAVSPLQYTLNSRSSSTAERVLALKPLNTHFCWMTQINMPAEVPGYHASAYGYLSWDNNGNWAIRADASSNSSGQPTALYSATCVPYSQAQNPQVGSRGSWHFWQGNGTSYWSTFVQPTPSDTIKEPVCSIGGMSGNFSGRVTSSSFIPTYVLLSGGGGNPGTAQRWMMVGSDGPNAFPLSHCLDLQIERKPNQRWIDLRTTYSVSGGAVGSSTVVTAMKPLSSHFCYITAIYGSQSGETGINANIGIDGNGKYALTTCPGNFNNGSVCSPGSFGTATSTTVKAACVPLPIATQ